MSFFIRKKNNKLTTSISDQKKGKPFRKNTDAKKRPAIKGNKNDLKRKNIKGKIGIAEKRPKFDKNEEIESEESDFDENFEEGKEKEEEEAYSDIETPQEKKLRLAKLYLEEIEKEEEARKEDEDFHQNETFGKIGMRLKEDVLEKEGRLKREVADFIKPKLEEISILTCSKHLKKSITCLCISPDDQFIYSGSKDGHLIKWSVAEKKKIDIVKRKEVLSKKKMKKGISLKKEDPNSVHSTSIMAIAISSDGKFLATGDLNNKIVIWNPENLKKIHIFSGHRGSIRGLVFRKGTHTLFSSSDDRSVRIWSLDEMGFVETLFGHQDAVTSIDALSRERAISAGGRDNSLRVWKIVEESQLVYNGHYNGNIECVKLINEEHFVSCGDDGLLCTWNVNRKKPLFVSQKPHGTNISENGSQQNRWLSSLAALTNTDLFVSGSSDGFLRAWKCGEKYKSLEQVFQVPIEGWINAIDFSKNEQLENKFIALGIGKEHKCGRWFENIKEAKNSIVIIPLSYSKSIS